MSDLIERIITEIRGLQKRVGALETQERPAVPSARVFNSASISLADNTTTALTFDTEAFDTDSIHSTSTNTGRLTCKTAGVYQVSGGVVFDSMTTPVGSRTLILRINGTTEFARHDENGKASGNVFTLTAPYKLAVDDYVEMLALQNSGGALLVRAFASYSPWFAMVRVG